MTKHWFLFAAVGLVATSACSSNTSTKTDAGPITGNSAEGSIDSTTVTAADSFFFTEADGSGTKMKIKVTSYAGACAVETAGNDKENSEVLDLQIVTASGDVTAATYTVASGAAEVKYDAEDGTCSDTSASSTASDGTITLTAVSASAVTGTFQLAFGSDSVSGTFSAPACAQGTVDGTCVP